MYITYCTIGQLNSSPFYLTEFRQAKHHLLLVDRFVPKSHPLFVLGLHVCFSFDHCCKKKRNYLLMRNCLVKIPVATMKHFSYSTLNFAARYCHSKSLWPLGSTLSFDSTLNFAGSVQPSPLVDLGSERENDSPSFSFASCPFCAFLARWLTARKTTWTN